jgi:hypothetical protein
MQTINVKIFDKNSLTLNTTTSLTSQIRVRTHPGCLCNGIDERQVEELETFSFSSGYLWLIRWCISELFGSVHFITKTKIIRQVLNILDLKCCWLKKTKLNTQKEEMNFVNLNCRVQKNCWVKKPKHFWFSYLYPHQLLKKIVELPILKKLTWIVFIIQEFWCWFLLQW